MADRYDGSVRIKTDADTTPAEKQLKKLQEKLAKQTEQVDKQAAAVKKLKEQYDQLSAGKTAPKGVSQMERDLKKAQAEAALSNSLGFGGHNATLALKRFRD